MTKFILIGGYPHKAADGGKALCEEMVSGFAEPVKMLICPFARAPPKWDESFASDKAFFQTHLPNKKIEFAMADPDMFVQQVKWAHIIYFRGGITRKLIKALKSIDNWRSEVFGKTIVGTSAGADALSKYHFNLDTLQPEDGLGIIPIKVIPHWKSDYNAPNIDWDKAKESLDAYKEKLPIFTLGEGQYVVRVN